MAISTLVETSIGGNDKWSDSDLGADDCCIYGIPYNARKVVRFNPVDESMEEIGPDLGDAHGKWKCGVLAHNGCIYCAPFESDLILKIDTIHGTVRTTVLDDDMIHCQPNTFMSRGNRVHSLWMGAFTLCRTMPAASSNLIQKMTLYQESGVI